MRSRLLLVSLILLWAMPCGAVNVYKVEKTDSSITIWRTPTQSVTVDYADLPNGNMRRKALVLEARLQAGVDIRRVRGDLVTDDPDRLTNPGKVDVFWDGTDIVERDVIVEVLVEHGDYQLWLYDTVAPLR